jgi:hypothetical protein
MHSAVSDLLILIVVIVLLWFAWVATGGPERFNKSEGLFLSNPEQEIRSSVLSRRTTSHPYAQSISIDASNAHGDTLDSEFITLSLAWNAPDNLNITGWTLTSNGGSRAMIGLGTQTPRQGTVNQPEDIVLMKGDNAIIASGRSPIGVSFKENICSGYIGILQTFTPHLSTQCPKAEETARNLGIDIDTVCADALRAIPACTTYVRPAPEGVSESCTAFIQKSINYNGCVYAHHDAYNFDNRQWRIYLNSTTELWDNDGGTISLYDETGAFVKSVKY